VPVLTTDAVRDVLLLVGGETRPGTAALLHALDAAEGEAPPVAAVVRCLARAGADGHTVLPAGLLTEMLVGTGASAEQSAAAVAAAVEAGHVLAFSPEPEDNAAETLLALADIGMAEESVAEAVHALVATSEVAIEDVPYGAVPSVPDAVDLRTADVVAAAALLERAAERPRVVLAVDSALPPPGGPGQVVADLVAAAAGLGVTVEVRDPEPGTRPVLARLCAAVRSGELPPIDDPTHEVVVVRAADGAEAAHRARQLVTDSLPRALGLRGDDVAVLTPVRRGPTPSAPPDCPRSDPARRPAVPGPAWSRCCPRRRAGCCRDRSCTGCSAARPGTCPWSTRRVPRWHTPCGTPAPGPAGRGWWRSSPRESEPRRCTTRLPRGTIVGVSPEYEYAPLRIPPGEDRATTQARLAVQAEFSGWELAHLRLYSDGSRKVLLRRRRTHPLQPGLSV
jgi:hypothetical protein